MFLEALRIIQTKTYKRQSELAEKANHESIFQQALIVEGCQGKFFNLKTFACIVKFNIVSKTHFNIVINYTYVNVSGIFPIQQIN